MSDLPNGWASCHLSDVVDDSQSGFASGKKDVKDGLRHLRMNNISVNGKLNLDLIRTVPRSLANASHYLRIGDVLVCTTNSGNLVGKSALFNVEGEFAFSNHLTRLRVKPHSVHSSYLHHQLWLLWKNGEFERKCKHWVNQSTLPKHELLSTEIYVPPFNEQRRIVAKLEKLLSSVDAAQERLATIPRILKRFRQSVLAAACIGQLTADWRAGRGNRESSETLFKDIQALRKGDKKRRQLSAKSEELEDFADQLNDVPDNWKWVTLDSLCDSSRGISYGVIKLGPEVEGGVPCLRTSNVRRLRIDVKHVKRISADISADYGRTVLKGNEILVNVRGTLGGVAVVPSSLRGWNISREVALIPCVPIVDRKFVAFWIASNRSQNWLSGVEKGVAYTGINLEDLRLLPTALPPLAEQQEIVRRVETLFRTAEALEARYNTAKAHVDKLTQSVLAKAFRGELVPQDPNDESGSVLLERLRSTRNTQ